MPYIPPLTDEQIPDEARETFDAIQSKLGTVLNIFRTLAYSPGMLNGMVAIDGAIKGELPGKLRELAYIRASAVNNCEY